MARLIHLTTIVHARGKLTVIERVLPFEVKRIFYIYEMDGSVRGGHRHRRTYQAAIAMRGGCVVSSNDGVKQESFVLDNPGTCLLLEPKDWHQMRDFTADAMLMVLASEHFDPDDYIFENYA